MLSEKRIEKLWADDLRLSYAADMPGMPRMQDVLRFARLVEAAACENLRRDADIELLDAESRRVLGTMLRTRARAARKAAEADGR